MRNDHPDEPRANGDLPPRTPPHPFEWVVAAISTLLLLGMIGVLLYEAIFHDDLGPAIQITVEQVVPVPPGFRVDFVAENSGDATAAGVLVEGTVTLPDGTKAAGEATLDYVPAQSARRGGIFLTEDPREHPFELLPRGFTQP